MRKKITSFIKKIRAHVEQIQPTEQSTISLHALNLSQFFGALNDNIFKLFLIFMMISKLGEKNANSILSLAGAVFVIPFLFFSHASGVLADRMRKRSIIISMKALEIFIMLCSILAFFYASAWASFSLLFLLASQSAIFGPSKYGIIPEIVPYKKVPKANGLIVSFTYLAIIFGTFLASFITEISDRNFVLGSLFCLLISILGFISSLAIKKTPAQGSIKKINPFFIREIIRTMKMCCFTKHLLTVMLGAAYFLFIGSYTQLNIIPYAMQAMGLSDIAGGYLFLATALGIACGAILAGKIAHLRIDLAVPCFAILGISILLFCLGFVTNNLIATIIFLILIGICGGFFIVPLESYIQLRSAEEKRGEIIATTNFLSFVGVLLAATALYLLNEALGLSAALGFAVLGGLTLIVFFVLLLRLSDFSFSFIGRKFLKHLYNLHTEDLDLASDPTNQILVLKEASKIKALLLNAVIRDIRFFIPRKKKSWLLNRCYSLQTVANQSDLAELVTKSSKLKDDEVFPCLFYKKVIHKEDTKTFSIWSRVFSLTSREVLFVELNREDNFLSFWKLIFKNNKTQIKFSKNP